MFLKLAMASFFHGVMFQGAKKAGKAFSAFGRRPAQLH